MAVCGILAPNESAPDGRHKYTSESKRPGVDTIVEGRTVAANGAKEPHGVNAPLMDPCGGVVSASVVSIVGGILRTGNAHYTDCGH